LKLRTSSAPPKLTINPRLVLKSLLFANLSAQKLLFVLAWRLGQRHELVRRLALIEPHDLSMPL